MVVNHSVLICSLVLLDVLWYLSLFGINPKVIIFACVN